MKSSCLPGRTETPAGLKASQDWWPLTQEAFTMTRFGHGPLVVVTDWHLVVTSVIGLRGGDRAAGDNRFVCLQSTMQAWACWDQLRASASRRWNWCLRPTSLVWCAWSKKWCPTWRRGVRGTSWSWAASWAFRVCASVPHTIYYYRIDILRIRCCE